MSKRKIGRVISFENYKLPIKPFRPTDLRDPTLASNL
jgi:hypothetical protein